MPVAVPASGGCHDGLEPAGVNANQGAESTLVWLLALEQMRVLRPRETPARSAAASGRRAIAQPVGSR